MELILEQDDGEELKEKNPIKSSFFSLLPTLSYEKQLIIKGNNIGK